MSGAIETLLTDLTKEVRTNTESYIRLEATLRTELDGLRADYSDVKATVGLLASTQSSHAERLIASETRISDLQDLRRDLSGLHSEHRELTAQVQAHTPVRTPWTAIVTAVAAAIALGFTFFGK